jgi:hypothetical protein
LLILVSAVLNWRASTRLRITLLRLRAGGEPTSIVELTPQPVSKEQNAAAHLRRLKPQLDSFSQDLSVFYKTPLGEAYDDLNDRGALPTNEQCQAIKDILERHFELVGEIEMMADLPVYASLLDFELDHPRFVLQMMDEVTPFRSVARFLNWRMQTLTANGEPNAAVESGIQLLRLTRLFENEPAMVNHLVMVACRHIACQGLNPTLRSGQVTAELRAKLDAELALHNDPKRLPRVLSEERAVGLDAMADWRRGIAGRLLGWQFANWQADLIDFYDTQLSLVEHPWYESHEKIGDSEMAADYPAVVWMLAPAMQSTYEASNRDTALLRCLHILNALAAFRDEKGREAAGLADLDLPVEDTMDPFSGKPLIVKWTVEGWLIYTVFKNGTDDGGDFEEIKDWGLAPVPTASDSKAAVR